MRPFLRWLLFTACLAVFTGAMLWISVRTLDLEEQRRQTAEDAQVQEKVRLALWRMDSLASALLIRENSRPAYHYQAFYAPDDLFANATQSIPKGQALMPSPLFGSLPDLVQLHFEVVSGSARSPQAPVGSQKEIASNWYATSPQTGEAAEKLKKLDELLKRHPEIQTLPEISTVPTLQLKPAPEEKAKTAAADGQKLDMQVANNYIEQTQRAQILNRNLVAEKAEISKTPLKKIAPKPAAKTEIAGKDMSTLDKVKDLYRSSASSAAREPAAPGAVASATAPALRQSLPALAGDLRAVWADAELMLVRQARLEGVARLQGVWLDWPQLHARLIDTVRDLLPEAKLVSVSPDAARTDATALVTLPVKLLTGKVPVSQIDLGSPLKPALAIAWACLIAAALAIAFVLHRAVLLSERRGAFVSAVTHELRTPLTTFRLYSEMLADDMVPDPERRREYLNTLCDESTRLMHLVENVLSFSRIERGRTAARMETVSVESLVQRIEQRLRQRTDQVGLILKTDLDHNAAKVCVMVDALAVEQILFNLADNACKYAAPDSDPRELHFTATADGKRVLLTVRDFGPGLSKQARKKLFQPFAKSATEAAHSAPGVGLGLALCRRLARELGGQLEHQPMKERGACFRLSLTKVEMPQTSV
ncbi:MAG: HAMP domain-containing sensor histidine kinase [Prosthecobacter sp.]